MQIFWSSFFISLLLFLRNVLVKWCDRSIFIFLSIKWQSIDYFQTHWKTWWNCVWRKSWNDFINSIHICCNHYVLLIDLSISRSINKKYVNLLPLCIAKALFGVYQIRSRKIVNIIGAYQILSLLAVTIDHIICFYFLIDDLIRYFSHLKCEIMATNTLYFFK